jgi:hypothetical protein
MVHKIKIDMAVWLVGGVDLMLGWLNFFIMSGANKKNKQKIIFKNSKTTQEKNHDQLKR